MEKSTFTYEQLMDLFLELRESQKETDRRFKETDLKFKETDLQFKETKNLIQENALSLKETEKLVTRISKDIGSLGNKFGSFNEALVFPSLERLFEEKFHCNNISQNQKFLMNGNSFEIDMLAISKEACYIIEIKSKFRKDDLKQILKNIEKYRINVPENKDKKIYGVIVATEFNKDNIKELEKNGIYFISISDDLVKLHESDKFIPKAW